DSCRAGACVGASPITCTASDVCHVAGTCDAATGACSNPAAADGTTCNDGNACTQGDACRAGTCTSRNPVACAPLDACHVAGVCNPSTGACSNPAAPNGTACGSDGGVNDVCNAGACAPAATTCAAGQSICKGICAALQSDPAN